MSSRSCLVLIFFCFCLVSLAETLNNGFSIELIHRDSTKSPFYNPAETQLQRVSNHHQSSINRANYFHQIVAASSTNITQTMTTYPGSGYFMSYSIGTPPVKLYGILDTGSDLTWFQCNPCELCVNQTSPIFDPSKSSTFKTLPCSSTSCNKLGYLKQNCSSNNQQHCEYKTSYGADSTYSQGDLSVDTLTLHSTNGSPITIPSILIGCGHKNRALLGGSSGIVGFGRGPLSLASQLSSLIGGKFSYCLVPLFSDLNTSSPLYFGDAAVVSGPGTVSTPMLLLDGSGAYYYVTNLVAFRVGDNIINVIGSTIIDSGTTIGILPADIYDKFESAVAALIKLERVKDPTTQNFTLCYKTTIQHLEIPKIIAHFDGGDVQLNAINTFMPVDHEVVCFAFIPAFDSIFGSIMQQNLLVGFDNLKKTVSFKPTDCTKL